MLQAIQQLPYVRLARMRPADSTTLPPPLCAAASQCSSQHNCATEDGPENEREKEPELSFEDGSLLDGLEITANLDTIEEKSLLLSQEPWKIIVKLKQWPSRQRKQH